MSKGAWVAPEDSKPRLRLYNSLTRRKVGWQGVGVYDGVTDDG